VIGVCGVNFPKAVNWTRTGKPINYAYFDLDDVREDAARRRVRFAIITGPGDFRYAPILDVFHGGYALNGFQAKLFDVPGMGHVMPPADTLREALDFIEAESASPMTDAAEASPEAPELYAIPERTWTSATGFEMNAALIRVDEGRAILRRADGEIVEIRIDNFSDADRARIHAYQKESAQ
jgi:hypothetical protein